MAGFLAGFGQGALDYSNQLNSNAYRQALLQLNQQNQQLRARQVLAELANQKRQQQTQALFGQAITGAMAQPAAPFGQDQPQSPGGGMLPSSFPQVPDATSRMADNSAALGLIAKDESGGRNIPNFRFDAGHTASGPLQITDTTWNRYAPQVGAPQLRYPASPMDRPIDEQYKVGGAIYNKEGPAPWANFNPKLAADLRLSPEAQQQGGQVAIGAAGMLPPQMVGRGGPDLFARLVDRVAGSNAPDDVKGAALMQLLPLMSQEGQRSFQQAFEMLKFQSDERDKALTRTERQQEFGIRQQELGETRRQNVDFRQQMIDIQRQRVDQGQQKIDQAQASPLTETQANYWAKIVDSGGALPPGVARNKAMISQIMSHTASGTGDPGEFISRHATVQADARSLANMTKMTDAAESFERTANANLDNALRLSKGAVPTDMGPWVNKWLETGDTQFGGENVPPYVAAVLTAANEYAKIMNGSTGSQGSTVDSRREAAELLSPYLSTGQITEVAKVLKQDMANRKQQLHGQLEDIKARLKTGADTTQPQPQTGAGHKPGDIIEKGGKRWRVIGGDPNDPDVEPAQ